MSGTLVVCAHPDDETFGCGGTIAKWGTCSVIALTDGVSSRQSGDKAARARAFAEAMKILGVERFTCLNLPDQRLDELSLLDIVKEIEREILYLGPDTILTHHHGDLNRDHRIVAEAVMVATRPPAKYEVLSFELPSSTEWTFGTQMAFRPNVFVELTDEQLDWKLIAAATYKDEIRTYPHPRSADAMIALDRYRGQICGCKQAEAFQLLRGYR